jgi:ATP-binding cassette subfamily B protein
MLTSHIDEHLPKTLGAFVWRYLRHKKWCLVGFFFIALVFAIDMSLSPYLLKVIIDKVVQHAHDPSGLIHVIMLPVVIYASMSIILNLVFRLYDYINLQLYPYLKSEIDKDMFAYVLNHSYTFFQNNFAGSITKKLAGT